MLFVRTLSKYWPSGFVWEVVIASYTCVDKGSRGIMPNADWTGAIPARPRAEFAAQATMVKSSSAVVRTFLSTSDASTRWTTPRIALECVSITPN